MLQKLENAYLTILRVVVILSAGGLLAGVAFFGLSSFQALSPQPEPQAPSPQVTAPRLIERITPAKPVVGDDLPPTQAAAEVDPHRAHHEKAAAAILRFVARHGSEVSLDKADVVRVVRNLAQEQDSPELVAAFARNLAETLEKTLADPAMAKLAADTPALDLVNSALDEFKAEFKAQIEAQEADDAERLREHQQRKAEGQQSLYMAGGAFGAFLLIVFLSIFIRIERNLRHLEARPLQAA